MRSVPYLLVCASGGGLRKGRMSHRFRFLSLCRHPNRWRLDWRRTVSRGLGYSVTVKCGGELLDLAAHFNEVLIVACQVARRCSTGSCAVGWLEVFYGVSPDAGLQGFSTLLE